MTRPKTGILPLSQVQPVAHAGIFIKIFLRDMQVDPELLSPSIQDDDLGVVAPDLLELSHNMEQAQTRIISTDHTERSHTEEMSSISSRPIPDPHSFAILREFVSSMTPKETS